MKPSRSLLLLIAASVVAAGAYLGWQRMRGAPTPPPSQVATVAPAAPRPAGYVGSQACAGCHAAESAAWAKSQHAEAMKVPTEATVLGDFDDATYRRYGLESRFYRRDGAWYVHTDGPDGRPADFKVEYTFGVYPLQQYLVDIGRGRLQALSLAWDSRPAADGGQRWFHLYPNEKIDFRDELHWTGRQQNWNYMCADCHATDLRKNYDRATDTFATRWAELGVGCEGCHGPGSAHVEWAQAGARSGGATPPGTDPRLTVRFDARRENQWRIDPATGNAAPLHRRRVDAEVEVCAQCHSRRGQFSNGYRPGERLMDHYLPALITPGLYYPDGQQHDEVYNWGSFMTSRMYSKGVTCSDCHDPHGGKPRAAGNTVCAQCHLASKYDTPRHHFHPAGSPGAACAACHMPTTTYMVVDPRHDHSFRIPRPDLSRTLGVPNACNQCHADRTPEWAATEVRARYPHPKPGFQDFATVFADADRGDASATIGLVQLVANQEESAMARASALARLARAGGENAALAAEAALHDPSALVRHSAIGVYESVPPGQRLAVIPLLRDPLRAVRMQAARVLAAVPEASLGPGGAEAYAKAADEYVAAENFNADRPESRTNLGTYYAERGRWMESEAEFRSAIALDPAYVPAWVNLADLMRLQHREDAAEAALRDGLVQAPKDAMLHHALGLALVRQHRGQEALAELRKATELDPGNARFAEVYGIAKTELAPEAGNR
ncbi:MAG: multiheme c-type cytochrome [Steroidobacteraceae bacterium]